MLGGGRSIRAFRPGHFSQPEEMNEEAERIRQSRLDGYAERAQAGLPLFELVEVLYADSRRD